MRTLSKNQLQEVGCEQCEYCGEDIPEGKEKFIFSKVVCEWCFNRLKKNNTSKRELNHFWDKFIKRELR